MHKLNVGTGTEVRTGGWPELAGTGKSASQLTIGTAKDGTSFLYTSNSGHGHITTINLTTGTGRQHDPAQRRRLPAGRLHPTNWAAGVKSDQDIGSGGLLILPTTLSRKFPNLGVQPGKDKKIRLLNLADLSGKGGPGNLGGELQLFSFPQMSLMRAAGAVWTNPADKSVWVFVPGDNGIAGFQVVVDSAGNPSLSLKTLKVH